MDLARFVTDFESFVAWLLCGLKEGVCVSGSEYRGAHPKEFGAAAGRERMRKCDVKVFSLPSEDFVEFRAKLQQRYSRSWLASLAWCCK